MIKIHQLIAEQESLSLNWPAEQSALQWKNNDLWLYQRDNPKHGIKLELSKVSLTTFPVQYSDDVATEARTTLKAMKNQWDRLAFSLHKEDGMVFPVNDGSGRKRISLAIDQNRKRAVLSWYEEATDIVKVTLFAAATLDYEDILLDGSKHFPNGRTLILADRTASTESTLILQQADSWGEGGAAFDTYHILSGEGTITVTDTEYNRIVLAYALHQIQHITLTKQGDVTMTLLNPGAGPRHLVLKGLYQISADGSFMKRVSLYAMTSNDGFELYFPPEIPVNQNTTFSLVLDAEYDPRQSDLPITETGYRDAYGHAIAPVALDISPIQRIPLQPGIRLVPAWDFNLSQNQYRFMDVEDVEHEQTFARFRQQFDAWDAWEADTHQRAFTRFQQQFDAWDAKDEWETNTHQQAFTRFQQQFDAWGVKDTKNAQEANTQPLNGLDTVHIKNQNDVSKGADEKQLNTAHRQAFDKFQRNHRSIDISVLENPRWLRKAGMSKGIDHDRQALNFILPAGNGFRIRQTNKNFTQSLTLRLLNDDHVNESAYSILPARYGWKNISHSSTSVLFIDTPYVEGHQDKGAMPVIEIDWHPGDIKELPRYRRGDNEAAFFRTWDGEDAEFALLESDYIRILVPKKDKNVVRHLDQHNKNPTTIDKLLDHYDTVIPFFNKLAGLDFDAKQPWNRNPKNKYFAKADKSGPGTGYYGNHWTAESGGSDSVATFWLLDKDNWGRLHEIAHGYQGHFLHDGLFHEVWNNIYAASWQNAQLGNRVFQEGWLYDYGHAEALVATVHHHLASRVPLKQWDAREKLYFMMLMKDKAGDAAFIHFNQEYRKKAADPTFNAEQHNLLDMLAESYAIAGGIDVRPLIQLVDSGISERLSSSDAFNTAVPVLPLNQIITDDSSQKEVQNLLKLDSPLRLVSAADLAEVGLAGNLTVALDNLAGKNLTAALDSPAGKNLTAALDSYDKEHQALHAVQDVVTTIQNTFGPPTYQYHNGGNGRTDNWVPERTGFRTPNATEQTHQRHYFLPGNNPGHQYNNRWGEIHRRGKTNIPFVQNTFRPPTYQYHNGGNGSMEEMMAIFPSAQSASVYPAVTYPATATMHNINYPLSLPQYQLQQ